MRIALVSAHYPPNFLSGGTLVPQRIAESLARQGHEVFVFAGEIAAQQPDLLTRVETVPVPGGGGASVEVTWVTVTGRLGWSDRRNFTGPDMEAVFGRFLRRVRPDVVHLHALQGLGGGLVPLAAASGAATVVTMHDMWWWCARQFLVQPDMRPCNSVVAAGVCACEVDNTWLSGRNNQLAAQLTAADLVLAPSTPMLNLLASNGVPTDQLALDENPAADVVRQPSTPRAVRRPGPVRFVFAGGQHELKGGPLAVAAAGMLADLDDWSLDLYGFAGDRLPAHAFAKPPYQSDQVSTVLSEYDVLVMSSVALESYSLITREALAAGCVVITGDNPGPAEVVRDGVNGLVVPRGDAGALASAMRLLITDRALLIRLQSERSQLTLRSQQQQTDGLVEHYRRLLAAKPDRQAPVPHSEPGLQRVLLVSGITGAPLRYRGFLPAEALAGLGIHVDVVMYRDPRVAELAETADAVVLYRVPATDQIQQVIADIKARTDRVVPVLYDIDDLIVDPDLAQELNPILTAVPGVDLELYWEGVRRYRTTLEACDGYIGSTNYLCERVAELTHLPTYRFANGVGRELGRASDARVRQPRTPGPVRIGYFSGTNTHNEDWASIEPAIARLLAARPAVQLWLGGLLETSSALDPFADRIRRLPMTSWYQLPAALRDIDVNLAPLEPGRTFNEAKSAIKFLEAALVGTPTVASPSEPFREAITDGVTGLLAEDEMGWFDALLQLVDDPDLRRRMGTAAREHVQLQWSPAQQGERYRDILLAAQARLIEHGRDTDRPAWPVQSRNEPFVPTPTEVYGPLEILADGSVRPPAPPRPSRLVWARLRSGMVVARRDGVGAATRRAVPILRRYGRRTSGGLVRRARRIAGKGLNRFR